MGEIDVKLEYQVEWWLFSQSNPKAKLFCDVRWWWEGIVLSSLVKGWRRGMNNLRLVRWRRRSLFFLRQFGLVYVGTTIGSPPHQCNAHMCSMKGRPNWHETWHGLHTSCSVIAPRVGHVRLRACDLMLMKSGTDWSRVQTRTKMKKQPSLDFTCHIYLFPDPLFIRLHPPPFPSPRPAAANAAAAAVAVLSLPLFFLQWLITPE